MRKTRNKPSSSHSSFGERIRKLRLELDLTQSQLALDLRAAFPDMRVSKSAVHTWEANLRTPLGKDVLRISRWFGVEPAWLQFGIGMRDQSSLRDQVTNKLSHLNEHQLILVDGMINNLKGND